MRMWEDLSIWNKYGIAAVLAVAIVLIVLLVVS